MAEAVQNSLQFLPEADLKAIAAYLPQHSNLIVPRFDAQIAAIANHVLHTYGNGAQAVTPGEVARVRSGNAGPAIFECDPPPDCAGIGPVLAVAVGLAAALAQSTGLALTRLTGQRAAQWLFRETTQYACASTKKYAATPPYSNELSNGR